MNKIISFSEFTEARSNQKSVVVTFGRFNPPTKGHEENFRFLKKLAQKTGGDFAIYTSSSQDKKKNPLTYKQKIKYLRKMFPSFARNIIEDPAIKTIIDIVHAKYKEGYTQLTLVVGEDRLKQFKEMLLKYNGKATTRNYFKFDKIDVVSSGGRTKGISASAMRQAAVDDDYATFQEGMPSGFNDATNLFNDVRVGMGLKPSTKIEEEAYSEAREKYIQGQLFPVGSIVNGHFKITSRKTNFVEAIDMRNGTTTKFFIKQLI